MRQLKRFFHQGNVMFTHLKFICTPIVLLTLAPHVFAGEVLDRIKQKGSITLGYRESADPISYIANGKPVGYALDICHNVVTEIKKQLKTPQLKIEYKAVNSTSRIPEVLAGNIDIECGTTTNNKQRQQQVAFSTSYYVADVRMAVKKTSNIQTLKQLNGKAVVTVQGGNPEKYLKMSAKKANIKIISLGGKDHADAFSMLSSGRAAAFVNDDIGLAGLIAKSANPKDYEIVGPTLSSEPYGIMFAKTDPQLKSMADGVVNQMWKSGQMDQLYKKWFQSPIPPKNINLNLAPSGSYKALKAKPNDVGI